MQKWSDSDSHKTARSFAGPLDAIVYAQHGRETNGVKVPCRRTYFIELYGDDNY